MEKKSRLATFRAERQNCRSQIAIVIGELGVVLVCLAMSSSAWAAPTQKRSKPLVLVINYSYQITGKESTNIHVTLFKPDFTPAAHAIVKVDGKKVCTADRNGVCIFSFVPGNQLHHTLVARLVDQGTVY